MDPGWNMINEEGGVMILLVALDSGVPIDEGHAICLL